MSLESAEPRAILAIFATFPASVQKLARSARRLVLDSIPGATEIPDAKARLVGYGYGTGYKDIVATIILSKMGVKIGLAHGASLTDPAALLRGAGKIHRHIDIRSDEHLGRVEVKQLLEAAVNAWRRRSQKEL
jgi:hypothetical protein